MLVRLFLLSVAVASGSAFCVSLKPRLAARRSLPHTAPTMVIVPLKDTEVCPHSLPMPRGFGCLPSPPDPALHSFLVPTPPLDGLQEEVLQGTEEARVALEESDAMLENLRGTNAALRRFLTPISDDLVMLEGEKEPGVMMVANIAESEVQGFRPLWQSLVAALVAVFLAYGLALWPVFQLISELTRAH